MKTHRIKIVLTILLVLALLCGCDNQAQQPEQPSENEAVVQQPGQKDPVENTPGTPEPPVENRVPLDAPEPQVSANPAIQNFVNALNAALAENGHPIVLTIENPEALIHEGELKVIYNG